MSSINYDMEQLELSDFAEKTKLEKKWYSTATGQWIIQNCIPTRGERKN